MGRRGHRGGVGGDTQGASFFFSGQWAKPEFVAGFCHVTKYKHQGKQVARGWGAACKGRARACAVDESLVFGGCAFPPVSGSLLLLVTSPSH